MSDTETENPHAKAVLMAAAAMQRATLLVTPPAIVVSVVVFLVLKGMPGLVGGLIGGGLGLLSSLATLAMMRFSAGQDPMFSMVIALGGYIFKILVLFGALTLLKGIAIVNPIALGVTLLVAVIISAAAEVRAQKRAKIPTIIPAGS